MKKILLFCFMGVTAHAFAQKGQNLPGKAPVPLPDTSAKKPALFIRCGSTLKKGDQPLFIIDGIASDNDTLKEIKPADIKSITNLKESAAAALYGYVAARGVIVITTKKASERTFSIRSKEGGAPVPGATIKIIIDKTPADTITMVAGEEGEVVTDRLDDKKEYTAIISSVGYKPQLVSLTFKGRADHPILFLERKENVCENITVVAYPVRRITCYCGYSVVTTRTLEREAKKDVAKPFAGIFPNPVGSAGMIYRELDESFDGDLQVLNASGQLVQSVRVSGSKGSVLSYRLPNLAAGNYFIRFINQKLSRSKVEKLVVQ